MHTTSNPDVTRLSVDREYLEYTLASQRSDQARLRSHWFAPETMRMWGTRIMGEAYTGAPRSAVRAHCAPIVFVTSEPYVWDGPRVYTVRLLAQGEVETIGELGEYPTRSAALSAARRLAATRATAGQVLGEVSEQG